MANQVYAKQKITLWSQGYADGLKGVVPPKGWDKLYYEGYEKGIEIAKSIKDQGLSLTK